jgi:putative component of membrane protein insertase Oxa1/YidC/SpoIIIJ protein YidD
VVLMLYRHSQPVFQHACHMQDPLHILLPLCICCVYLEPRLPASCRLLASCECSQPFVPAGKTYGVAKNVTLHAVRVLDCDGTAQLSALLKVCTVTQTWHGAHN